MEKETERLNKVVNSSGFPFQIGVQYLIKESYREHRWRIVAHEYPWNNQETGNDGFIDIIISKDDNIHTMVIECKRTSGGEWIFLVPKGKPDRNHGQCVYIKYSKDKLNGASYLNCSVEPSRPEAEFCVIKGQNKSIPMLERLSAILLESTESFGLTDSKLKNQKYQKLSKDLRPPSLHNLYFPVIVTNTPLYVCYYEASKISVSDGKIQGAKYMPVQSVWFRKSLSTSTKLKGEAFTDIKELCKAKERAVFVVNSSHVIEFLKEWEVSIAF